MAVNGILGIKLGMTQVFQPDGTLVGCTVLQAGPCVVVERRTKGKHGYDSVQLGLVEFVKPQRVNKAMTGHYKSASVAPMKLLREVRIEESSDETKVGDRVLVDRFKAGELVDVSGVSKGRGFQGGVKRWHYRGGDSTHGSMFHRRELVPLARVEEPALPGSHGERQGHDKESRSRESGRGREFASGARICAGTERCVHHDPQGEARKVIEISSEVDRSAVANKREASVCPSLMS